MKFNAINCVREQVAVIIIFRPRNIAETWKCVYSMACNYIRQNINTIIKEKRISRYYSNKIIFSTKKKMLPKNEYGKLVIWHRHFVQKVPRTPKIHRARLQMGLEFGFALRCVAIFPSSFSSAPSNIFIVYICPLNVYSLRYINGARKLNGFRIVRYKSWLKDHRVITCILHEIET